MPFGRTGPRLRGWTPAPAGPRSPPSAWLENLFERLPSKSSKHTKQVCQPISQSKSSKQVFQASHPGTCLEDLLGRLARETCLGDLIGRPARRIYIYIYNWETCPEGLLGLWPNKLLSGLLVNECVANCNFIWAVLSMSKISCCIFDTYI